MSGLFDYKKAVEKKFKESAMLIKSWGFNASCKTVSEITESFMKKELLVVTVGEMKRGKSSMLNALLEEKPYLFPMNVAVATNVVTIVRYGEKEKIEVVIKDSQSRSGYNTKIITREEIKDYVSEQGNPSNYKNVSVLNIEVPNSVLKEGVVFVDTPGVGSLNVAHADVTYGFLPNADLLLFVCDASAGLTETELEFLKSGYKYCKNIIFPITKKDLNLNYELIESDNKAKISEATGMSENEVITVPVSSLAKLRYLETGKKPALVSSNFCEFEQIIWSTIAKKRGEIMFTPFIEQVKNELYNVADSLNAQYQLVNSGEQDTKKMIEELNKQIEELNVLQLKNAEWRGVLAESLQLMANKNTTELSAIQIQAKKILDENITNMGVKICKESQYIEVYNKINSVFSEGLLELKDHRIEDTKKLSDEINKILKLDVNPCTKGLENIKFTPDESLSIQFPKRKKSDKAMAFGRKMKSGVFGGGGAGVIFGGVVGAVIGTISGGPAGGFYGAEIGAKLGGAVGGALGGFKGTIDALKTTRDVDVPIVQKAFINHIETSMNFIRSVLNESFIVFKTSLTSEFESAIERKKQDIRDNIEQLKEAIKSVGARAEQRKLLEARIEELKTLLKSYNDLDLGELNEKSEQGAPDDDKNEKRSYNFI